MKVLLEAPQTLPQFSRFHLIKDFKDKILHSYDLLCKDVLVDGKIIGILFKMIDVFDDIEDVNFVLIAFSKIVDLK